MYTRIGGNVNELQQRIQAGCPGLFVTDLDGTLLSDRKEIDPENRAALQQLKNLGYVTAIATGRSNYSFLKLMADVGIDSTGGGLPIDYVIFSTGAGIMDYPSGTIIRSISLDGQDVQYVAGYLDNAGVDYMIHKPVPETRYFLYRQKSKVNPDFQTRLQLYGEFAAPLNRESFAGIEGATEILCIAAGTKGHKIAAKIGMDLKMFSVIKATSPLDGWSIWIEIFAAGVSKSRALSWLTDCLQIPRTRVCAVGNDYNDEDLLHWAGKSFVVSNSPSSLRECFPSVSSNNRHGVAEAVAGWIGEDSWKSAGLS